jgi:hypothetical protein
MWKELQARLGTMIDSQALIGRYMWSLMLRTVRWATLAMAIHVAFQPARSRGGRPAT